MLYITGDTHNTIDMHNASSKQMRRICELQKVEFSDISHLIILGDFGLPWIECPVDEDGIHPANKEDRYLLDWYNEKPFKILALMGNHDNYNMISKLPEVEMFGGKVLKVSQNIFYLKRGHIYNIEGNTFLALGGAKSQDTQFRNENIDWWPQEEMSFTEMNDCLANLALRGNKVDYVLSHNGPTYGIKCLSENNKIRDRLEEIEEESTVRFNNEIDSRLEYKKWFFGHWHSDWGFSNRDKSKYIPLYHKGVVIPSVAACMHKITYVIKYNFRPLINGELGELSEYKYINCWDMSYEEALANHKSIRRELIYELGIGSNEDLCLEEMYIERYKLS